jgi:hypothetical protein
VPTVGAEVAVDAAVAWACGLVAAVDAVEAADPASNGAQLWAAGSTPVNLTARRRASRSLSPRCGELARNRGADAAASTRDQRNLAVERAYVRSSRSW